MTTLPSKRQLRALRFLAKAGEALSEDTIRLWTQASLLDDLADLLFTSFIDDLEDRDLVHTWFQGATRMVALTPPGTRLGDALIEATRYTGGAA